MIFDPRTEPHTPPPSMSTSPCPEMPGETTRSQDNLGKNNNIIRLLFDTSVSYVERTVPVQQMVVGMRSVKKSQIILTVV